jgi:hypothetical protein
MFRYLSRVALIAAAWDDRVDRRRQRDVIAWLQVERRHCQPVESDQLLPRVGLGESTAHCALVSGIDQLPRNSREPAADLRRRGGYPVRDQSGEQKLIVKGSVSPTIEISGEPPPTDDISNTANARGRGRRIQDGPDGALKSDA